MGIVFRQSIKSTISTLTGAVLGALIIYLSREYIRDNQELGFRDNLINQAVVGGHILLFGLHNMLGVYIHRYADEDRRKGALLSISLVLPGILIALASLFYFLFKEEVTALFKPEDIPLIRHFFLWLPVFTLLFAYQVVLETYLISQLKVAKATFVREVLLRLLNLALILLYGFGQISFDALVVSTVLVYLIPISILWAIARQTDAWKPTLSWKVFDKKERGEIVHFTWYHSLLSVSLTLIGTLDVLMLAALSPDGLRAIPVYVVAVFLMSLLMIPYKAMLQATFPILAQAFAVDNQEKVTDVFTRSSINFFIASVAMWLLIVCNLPNAVMILPAGKGYEAIVLLVPILSIGRMMDLATGMNDQVLSISKHYKYNFYISVLLVFLLIGLNWLLIPRFNIYGAAWASSLALIVFNLLKFFIVKKKLELQPFSLKTPLVLVAALVAFGGGYFLPHLGNPFADTFCRSVLILGLYAGMLFWLKPSPDLLEYLQTVKKNKRLF